MRNGSEYLQFSSLIREMQSIFSKLPDSRDQKRVLYPLSEVAMAGLAMMFFQDPGLLPFQQRLQEDSGSSNLKTMFDVTNVPGDTQFRKLLDSIDPSLLLPGLRKLISMLQKTREWLKYRWLDGRYLVAIDGTEYFNSTQIHCKHCLERHHRNGETEYYHQVLVASLIHPLTGDSFPIWAEEVRREDGTTKQDCETNAASRLLPTLARMYPHLDLVIVADSLYSKTPIIDLVRSLKMNFIFVAKPGDHSHLYEQIAGLRLAEGTKSFAKEQEGNFPACRVEYACNVPLFATTSAEAHYIEYTEEPKKTKGGKKKKKPTEKKGYHNVWVSSIKPTKGNIFKLVAGGRHRSSIENQTFNALKNHGHHFEHNFGHGKNNLRFNFVVLNLLAFMIHQILSVGDTLYGQAKTWKRTVRQFYEYLRMAIRLTIWPDWETLLNFYLDRGPKLRLESG